MKLFVSPMSPYVRKVRAAAVACGLADCIEVILCRVRDPKSGLEAFNPLGRVPTLVLDDGSSLFDSPVICEYFDQVHGSGQLFPKQEPARWIALKEQAVGDGIMDAAVPRRDESLRPSDQQSSEWLSIYRGMVTRALAYLEKNLPETGKVTIGTLSIGCALGYLDFRFANEPWRDAHPCLADWFAQIEKLDALVQTKPYQLQR
jgi:glutathione S-transferase